MLSVGSVFIALESCLPGWRLRGHARSHRGRCCTWKPVGAGVPAKGPVLPTLRTATFCLELPIAPWATMRPSTTPLTPRPNAVMITRAGR
ncbi:hypothetical protein DMX12_12670 [Pseudomonas sp. MB-090624]|nr:hypothetical protein DMX12_12670 [Pseudomonas sp. MB-090624]